jgi:nucleoside-diphosphate-sugar epimerase
MSLITLVTGGNGFVGSALVSRLSAAGSTVRACCRSGRSLPLSDAITFPVGNIDGKTDWQVALTNVDSVIHCAARVHVMSDTALDPLSDFRGVNVEGTLNFARQAAAIGVKRFVFLSSIKVNGDSTTPGEPFKASDAVAPNDPYGISKFEAEIGLLQLAQETGLEVVIVRPPLVYGPNAKGNFAALARAIRRGLPLPLGAVTANRRSLVSLDNLIDFLMLCLHHPRAAGETFLVSDGDDLSTLALLQGMAIAMGCRSRLIPVPVSLLQLGAKLVRKEDVACRLLGDLQVDISKNNELLQWRPPTSVAQGLRHALHLI